MFQRGADTQDSVCRALFKQFRAACFKQCDFSRWRSLWRGFCRVSGCVCVAAAGRMSCRVRMCTLQDRVRHMCLPKCGTCALHELYQGMVATQCAAVFMSLLQVAKVVS